MLGSEPGTLDEWALIARGAVCTERWDVWGKDMVDDDEVINNGDGDLEMG